MVPHRSRSISALGGYSMAPGAFPCLEGVILSFGFLLHDTMKLKDRFIDIGTGEMSVCSGTYQC